MNYLIRGGRLMDPATGLDATGDLLIEEGRISALGELPNARAAAQAQVIAATGLIVCPGLIDMHVHLREPGFEYKETIASGTAAAAAGGFATICAEPNTNPPVDSPEGVTDALARAASSAIVRVHPKACMTLGQHGEEASDAKALKAAGAIALSDDGEPVLRDDVMRDGLRRAARAHLPITTHCEESLGSRSVRPWPQAYAAEADLIRRDISLLKDVAQPPSAVTGRPHGAAASSLHFSHLSMRESVAAIAQAKSSGLKITAEVTPHHCLLSADDIPAGDANFKSNPPLRPPQDRDALAQALVDGMIEVIASDHAPHAALEKARGWEQAPFGMIGLETTLAVMLTSLVHTRRMTLMDLLAKMTCNPARILRLPTGRLAVGAPADVTLIDPDREWVIDPRQFKSQGRNCPFAGWRVRGRAVWLFVEGHMILADGEVRYLAAGQVR